jgi:hypothetical protein
MCRKRRKNGLVTKAVNAAGATLALRGIQARSSSIAAFCLIWTFMAAPVLADAQGCLTCHQQSSSGFVSGHEFGAGNCTACHGGQAQTASETEAHTGMLAFPGNLSNAEKACGSCHQEQVNAVKNSPMTSGARVVEVTRKLFGEVTDGKHDFATMEHSPADSMLRKLCASCHLQQEKQAHELSPVTDRGGGCLACHINHYVVGQHPALSARVDGARCFGCHSRSGRISLNYVGLGEVDEDVLQHSDTASLGYLEDKRLVQKLAADKHHLAGMTCIDCHTSRDIMGVGNPDHGADISCDDCHRQQGGSLELPVWPVQLRSQVKRIPYDVSSEQTFLITKRLATPLWHIEVKEEQNLLYPKSGSKPLLIPKWSKQSHRYPEEHKRLGCNACHSQWAPQCYGCHSEYDPGGRQWDHTQKTETVGRWSEQRWNVRNSLPPLGVTADNRIEPFVPGMILSVDHPQFSEPLFRRLFAQLSPHTTGPARSCESCHRSATALGLGSGQLEKKDGLWSFTPAMKLLHDGLPADAWTDLAGSRGGDALKHGVRSFNRHEMERILDAVIPQPGLE